MSAVGTAALAAQALALGGMGSWLMLKPGGVVKSGGGDPADYPESKLMIYRICGLWVFASAGVSGYLGLNRSYLNPRLAMLGWLTAVHTLEVWIKYYGRGMGPHAYANVIAGGVALIGVVGELSSSTSSDRKVA
eukprot:TRINITY_DN6334_c0_g1_i1.p1 TRINITY_DN6334_c0_g1~~TRINITY_DN6334_c0_g1_i1.p1  ORF type:complete len:134 (+),score=17.07 TRINITY_DN6334_c0_g1_i1:58-459(+)